MDLANGDTVYVEAITDRHVRLTLCKQDRSLALSTRLTSDEARVMANALLAAVVEAEAHGRD